MSYHSANKHLLFLGIIIACLLAACSNSEYTGWDDIIVSQDSNGSADSSTTKLDYLPLDDSEYPYAGIPRIVIVTENYQKIKDRETEIPAKLQIWGEKAPESEIMNLTIRGRGNTSWDMPKKSYKIEFINKQSMLGMPKDRDWALIANYADKTLMKNYLMYHLSAKLGAYYAPRCEFVEFYLNNEYLGVYLLTETIKIAKKRINLPEGDNSFIVEVDSKSRSYEQIVHSHIIKNDSLGKVFRIHYPKNASQQVLDSIENHIQDFEKILKGASDSSYLSKWIDINEYIKHYWIQEFSKNPDACFRTSVFFSWKKDEPIKMGPVWDFDLSLGNYNIDNVNAPDRWYLTDSYWNRYVFSNKKITEARNSFWNNNKDIFNLTTNQIDSVYNLLQNAANNNFKKWNILESTTFIYHKKNYKYYREAIDDLKLWAEQRTKWINSQIRSP